MNYPNQPQQPYGGQMPPSQPLQQGYAQPNPSHQKRPKTGAWIVALIIIAAIAFGSGRASVGSDTTATPASATQAATVPAQPTSAPTKPTAIPKAKGPQTLFQLSGNGETTTQPFTAPATWTLSWSCTPDPVLGASGAPLYINIVQAGADTLTGDISATCKAGNTSGSSAESQSGQISLHIISGIDWSIKATT